MRVYGMATGHPLIGSDGTPYLMSDGSPAVDSGSGCSCCGEPHGQGDDCACVVPLTTVTITISGMTGSGTEFNGTYAPVAAVSTSGATCAWKWDFEENDPPTTPEIVITFSVYDDGSLGVRAVVPGGQEIFLDSIASPFADDFCDGSAAVFSTNSAADHPEYGGTITVTAD